MSNLIPFAIHYLLFGVPAHFCAVALTFCEGDAIRMATRHAGNGRENWIPLDMNREAALLTAEKQGVTQIRWNRVS